MKGKVSSIEQKEKIKSARKLKSIFLPLEKQKKKESMREVGYYGGEF